MKTTRSFVSTERYEFDFKHCTTGKGFAQVDTSQDAPYFGIWANPFTLRVVTYCEGDITIQDAANETEFIQEIQAIRTWNHENGHKFIGIDPGFNESLKSKFNEIGLSEMLH